VLGLLNLFPLLANLFPLLAKKRARVRFIPCAIAQSLLNVMGKQLSLGKLKPEKLIQR
jgi:hypothetical protein